MRTLWSLLHPPTTTASPSTLTPLQWRQSSALSRMSIQMPSWSSNRRFPWATRCRCGKGSAAGTSCSARNFCGSPRPCMTTSTRPASSSAPTRRMRTLSQPPTNLRHCCKRGPSRRTLIRSSWALPRPRPSSCSPTPIWRCALPISMSWIPTRRARA